MNPAGHHRGKENPEEPFVPDLSEGAETGVYLALLELLDEGLIVTGDEVIIDANSAACRLLERDYRQIAGQPLSELFLSERAFLDARARLFIQGEMRGSLRVALPGGRHRDFRFVAAARLRPGIHALILSPDLLAETAPDVSSLDPTPAADTVWPRLAAALLQPVIVVDDGDRICAANAAAITTLGLGREELVGRLAGERLGLQWPAADAPPLARLRPQPGGEELTARVLAGPQAGWRLLVLPPLGQPAATLPAPAPAASPATAQSNAVHVPLDVFDAASQAILVSDADNRIVAVNRAFTQITGYSREDVLGRNPGLLNSGRQEPEFYAALWQSLRDSGQWQGEIWNRRKNGEIFPEWLTITAVRDGEGATRHYIAMFTDLTAKRQAESRTEYLAHHDILTGLPNRRLFERRFDDAAERARQRRCSVGVMRLDIDNFKAVNREYGDNVGDAFLQQIARRLLAALPRGGMVARERSDAFLALLPDLDLSSECGRAAEALLATLSLPFEAEGHNLQLTASIGIALLPEDGNTLDALLRHADAALAHARRLGGNNHQYYVLEMDDAGIEREAFESKLRYAIEREELEVHFQPLIDARDGSIRAGEALLRWHHPELGLIPFRRFISAARDGGLVARLGDWALRAACRAAVGWPAEGNRQPMVTVNVAIEQIMQGDFVGRVATALAESGLPADRLELDLDEQVLQEDNSRIFATLTELAGMGVHLAIDDFGRGLTAIPKLKRYPLQALKLDPALVRDVGKSEESEAIVEAIANLANSLGLAIFARGVEDEAQQAFLSALACHLQQGPLFGRPLTDTEFAAFLARQRLESGLQ